MRNSTLLFLVKRSEGEVSEVCLAMKKRGFGVGRWNGVGGKVSEGETIEGAAVREAKEEIGVEAKGLKKVAELSFAFPANPSWDQMVHAYLVETWEGIPAESEEMSPKWFAAKDIPFDGMWPDDIFWLPHVLEGKAVRAKFSFGEKDAILSQEVGILSSL